MFLRTLLLPICGAALLLSQDPPPKPETTTPVLPLEPTPLQPPVFKVTPGNSWGRKFLRTQPTPSDKPGKTEVCIVPLTNVTPPARPFMPNIRPKSTTSYPMTIVPTPPVCEDDRGDLVSRSKDSKPEDKRKP